MSCYEPFEKITPVQIFVHLDANGYKRNAISCQGRGTDNQERKKIAAATNSRHFTLKNSQLQSSRVSCLYFSKRRPKIQLATSYVEEIQKSFFTLLTSKRYSKLSRNMTSSISVKGSILLKSDLSISIHTAMLMTRIKFHQTFVLAKTYRNYYHSRLWPTDYE